MDDTRTLDELLPPEGEQIISVRGIAERTGAPLGSIYDWMNRGRLENWRLPNRRRVTTVEALERCLRAANPLPPREQRVRQSASSKARSRAVRAELKRRKMTAK